MRSPLVRSPLVRSPAGAFTAGRMAPKEEIAVRKEIEANFVFMDDACDCVGKESKRRLCFLRTIEQSDESEAPN